MIALVALWLVGMSVLSDGYLTVEYLTQPASSTLGKAFEHGAGDGVELVRRRVLGRALLAASSEHHRVTLPIGVAQTMLGALLVLVSANAFFARRASVPFALQVIAANLALLAVGYLLHASVRQSVLTLLLEQARVAPEPVEREQARLLAEHYWLWAFRVDLVLQALVLLLGGFALTRRRALEVLGAPAPVGREGP